MNTEFGTLALLALFGLLLFFLFLSKSREDKQYLAAQKERAVRQFTRVSLTAADSTFAMNGATAEVVHEEESVKRTNGLIHHYSLTRYVRNEQGEYFMLMSTEGQPFVKHVSQSAAKVALRSKYRSPTNDG